MSQPTTSADGTGSLDASETCRVPLGLRIVVLVLVALASSSAYLTRHCLAVASTTIQSELNLNSEDMGWVFSVFALGYLVFQIPGGVIGLRIGTRNALPLFSVLWSAMTVWTSFVFSLVPLLISRFAFGLSQAGLVPNTAQVIKDWFPSRLHGSVSAMIGVAMSVGGMATFWITGELMEKMHWRSVFQAYSLVGVAWAILFWLVFRTRPEQHPRVAVTNTPEELAVNSATTDSPADSPPIWKFLTHSAILWMCIQAPFRAAGYNLFVTYFPEFLERGHGLSVKESAFYSAWPLGGVIIGGLIGGALIDVIQKTTGNRTLSRSGLACVSLVLTTVLTVCSAFASDHLTVVVLITLGSTFSGIASPAVWAGLIDLGGKSAAIVSGTSNMIGCFAGVAFTPVVGMLVDNIKGDGTMWDGRWDVLILLHAGFYAVAAISFSFVRIGDTPVTELSPAPEPGEDVPQ